MMARLAKISRLTMWISAPLALILFAGAITAFLYGQPYREKINSKSFIDIAIRSVEEAYQLILKAEQADRWTLWLATGGAILAGIALLSFLLWRLEIKRQLKQQTTRPASGVDDSTAATNAASEPAGEPASTATAATDPTTEQSTSADEASTVSGTSEISTSEEESSEVLESDDPPGPSTEK